LSFVRIDESDVFLLDALNNKLSKAGFEVKQNKPCLFCSYDDDNLPGLAWNLSDFVFGEREHYQLMRISKLMFKEMDPEDRQIIVHRARELMIEDNFSFSSYAGYERRENLALLFAPYLAKENVLSLKGMLRFRLSGYDDYLAAMITVAADEIMDVREGNALVESLNQFYRSREQGGKYHLLLSEHGLYRLFQEKDNLSIVEGGRKTGFEDIMIVRLLMIAPESLMIHTEGILKPDKSVLFLASVLGENCSLCDGCPLCRKRWNFSRQ